MSSKVVRNIKIAKDDRRAKHISIIIPSAGEGSRMRSIGSRSLIVINNITLFEYQVNLLNEIYPNNTIIMVTGFDAIRVMNRAPKNVICIENERYNETNVVRSIGMGLRAITNDEVLIIYGDNIMNRDTFNFPVNKSCILYANEPDITSDTEVGCIINDNKLENMFYGLPNRWLGILYLTGKELKIAKSIAWDKHKEKFFGFEMINEIINKNGEFLAFSPKGSKCIDIDCMKDIENVKNIST